MKTGDKVRLNGIVTRMADDKTWYDIKILGSKREAAIRVKSDNVRRKLFGRK